MELENKQTRRVPNLKGLRDMIKRNAGGTGGIHSSPGTIVTTMSQQHTTNGQALKSERTVKNESECSFTLTDDEDRENVQENGAPRRAGKRVHPPISRNGSKSAASNLVEEDSKYGTA